VVLAGSAKALIVEDSPVFRELLGALVADRLCCVEVLEAGGIDEAKGLAAGQNPDVVFVDVRLPDGNGLQLARELKDRNPHLTVVVCTSHDLPEYRDAARTAGATHFVTKDRVFSDAVWSDIAEAVRDRPRPESRP
jgi:DNA-binding NarL/FixJ family response regulator